MAHSHQAVSLSQLDMRQRPGWAKAAQICVAAAAVCCSGPKVFAELTAHDYSVELVATVAEAPPEITLQWLGDGNATSYNISRKVLGDASWSSAATLSGSETSWTDSNVTVGTAYEYQVIKNTGLGYSGYGYICAAIRRAPVENRGTMILVVEKDLGAALTVELARLQQDLIGDGWMVTRRDVSKTLSPPQVKDVIRGLYQADPGNTKALFLFGHIPIPFSGDIDPDMHEDDLGAWPADVYYAELDGQWTDSTVNRTNTYNRNVPGDGKFDQSVPPGTVRLQMGRVDLSNLTCFANKTPARYEVDLARQYLLKDHNFRHGQIEVERRAMIFDRMYRGMERESQTCAAWRSFPGFFGRDQVKVIGEYEYFPMLSTNSYMWSYVVSGGSIYGSDYIGNSDSWALNEPKVVFTSFLGSWFGQWDRESDFLRAPLGTSGYTLASIFSGQPQWILHPMGMGEPIGLAALLTQNNTTNGLYPPQLNAGVAEVHIDLMGDPSLRMHAVKPPGAVTGATNSGGVTLSWTASADPSANGYYVYKSNSAGGPFTRISGSDALTTLSFDDAGGTSADYYMVRAVKLEQTPGGSYYNLSQGMFYPDPFGQSSIPETPDGLAVSSISQGAVSIHWISRSPWTRGIEIQRRTTPDGTFATIAQTDNATSSYSDTSLSAGTYAYRVKALGFAGDSEFSGEAFLNLQSSSGAIVDIDTTTGGDWIGKYGSSGYFIVAAATNPPAYVTIGTSNVTTIVGSWNTTSDRETLLRPDGQSRLIADWVNAYHTPMTVSLRFSDSRVHRVSIYMVDYKSGRQAGTIELADPFTGRVFGSQHFTNVISGQYVTMDARNFVDIRLIPDFDYNFCFLSGIFFSEPGDLASPTITPPSGEFPGKTTVNMTGPPGATIRYTMDGSDPNANSPVFTGAFVLTTNAVIRAISMRDGYADSPIATASLTNTLQTSVGFLGMDSTTVGDWPTKYGQTGETIPAWDSSLPADVQVNISKGQVWTWSTSSSDPRAVTKNNGEPGRLATAWYDFDALQFDFSIYAETAQQIALYFLDWDNSGRVEDLTITDAAGAALYTQRLDNFAGGQYVILNARGFFQIKIQHVSGPNAILNGIFIGPGAQQVIPTTPAQLGAPSANLAGGGYTIRVNGQPGQIFEIQTSDNLQAWSVIGRTSLSSTSSDYSIPFTLDAASKFFRAVLSQ